ncbi:MAG: hypothetical protein AB7U82_20445 [Blastocatellales bacterium]
MWTRCDFADVTDGAGVKGMFARAFRILIDAMFAAGTGGEH